METRVYAVKRYLHRLGHAAGSARYACSLEQLIVGLAPVMAWGSVPAAGPHRRRFVGAHRKSVQRWLDDLQAAGLVAHEPERDQGGVWWRTQIVLLVAPEPDRVELETATRRAQGWTQRTRRRRRRSNRRTAALDGIRRRSTRPTARRRGVLARARCVARHEQVRRARVEAVIARASEARELLTHPFGAPPTSAQSTASTRRTRQDETSHSAVPAACHPVRTLARAAAFVEETGARARGQQPRSATVRGVAEGGIEREPADAGGNSGAERSIGRKRRDQEDRLTLRRRHIWHRACGVMTWPAGHACPIGRLREAWVAHRYGLDAASWAGSALAGARLSAVERRARHAIELYEQHAAHRPDDWPGTGPAALMVLASQARAGSLAGDVACLLILAKGMRAVALEHDSQRRERQAERARHRTAPAMSRFDSRRRDPAQWETSEQRRLRVRDQVLLAGGDPTQWPNAELAAQQYRVPLDRRLTDRRDLDELDGVGARAQHYQRALRRGDYQLASPSLPFSPPDHHDQGGLTP